MSNDTANTNRGPSSRTPVVRAWPLAVGLLFAVALVLLFRWFGSEVLEGETLAFDHSVRDAVHDASSPALTSLIKVISFTGKVAFLSGLGVIVAATIAYLRQWRALMLFLVTMAGEIVLEVVLKLSYGRARPDPFFDLPSPSSYSFPSGHALGSLCFYGIIAFIFVRHANSRSVRIAVATAAAVWAAAIGFSRIYLGVHYPSDVLGGFFVGLIWLATVILTDRLLGSASKD
ncbi:MAG: phosphatase PAP2 family protein [Acidobacteriota bacterium]